MKTTLTKALFVPALLALTFLSTDSVQADQASADKYMNGFEYTAADGTGHFYRQGNGVDWTEYTPAKTQGHFKEIARGKDYVVIYDASRQATLIITRTKVQAIFPGWKGMTDLYRGKFIDVTY